MGLGSKIKDALHGDTHEKTTSEAKPPGAFPQDDVAQRHSDGKQGYVAPHGSLVDNNRNNSGQAGSTGHTGTSGISSSGMDSTRVGSDSLGSSGTQRNKLHKEGEGYLPSQAGQTTSTHGTRSHEAEGSGVGLGDQAKDSSYWGDLPPGTHGSKGNHGQDYTTSSGTGHHSSSLVDRTAHDRGHTTGSAPHHSPLHGDQAVGGGVYNTVTGVGSQDYNRSHSKPHTSGGAVHDPLTSSSKGVRVPTGQDNYDYKTSLGGAGAPTSRDDGTGTALAGPGAGAVGTGYGAGDLSHASPGHAHNQQSHTRGTDTSGYGGDHFGTGTSERGLSHGGLSHGGQGGPTGSGLTGGGLTGSGLAGSGVGRSGDISNSNSHSHSGAGLAGAGAAAAAGYGAHEFAHRGEGNTGRIGHHDAMSGEQHAPGVPRSSMLDVDPPRGPSGSHSSHANQASGVPHSSTFSSERGVADSHSGHANEISGISHNSPLSPERGATALHSGHNTQAASSIPYSSTSGSERGVAGSPSHHGGHGLGASSTNAGSGVGSHLDQSSSESGPGNGHYGPGHPGAKVMHKCQHCGNDNDISHYFKKDVVYRLGQ